MTRRRSPRCVESRRCIHATGIGAFAFSWLAKDIGWDHIARIDYGAAPDCNCHDDVHADAWRVHGHVHCPLAAPNQVWAYDFVHDACANGQKLKCLTLIDEFTRECLAIDVAGSIRSTRVIEVLSRLISERGVPMFLRSDNGPEFVSHAILRWLSEANIDTALIDPGKPWQNGDNESFNGKFRDECLSMEWFRSRTEARVVVETWRRHYNAVRPHSSLDYRTPLEFRRDHESTTEGAILK